MKKNSGVFFGTSFALCIVYIAGKHAQQDLSIPSWIRWHMADFGYVGAWAWIFPWFNAMVRARKTGVMCIHKHTMLVCASAGCGVALLNEASQAFVGSGDPIDVACFVVSLLLLVLAYNRDQRSEITI